jgi:Asp-tRNA(Asn)/Glu-tRNA(Gln) amidotransferase A subunit family amidase
MLAGLVAAVREKRVSARELVEMAYERIGNLDPGLHAVVVLRDRDQALAEADGVDVGRAAGRLPGIPMVVKDNTDVEGMRTTHASRLLEDVPPAERDAAVVERLRSSGAIVVGKTNIPEFSFQGFTDNALFGATGNPWGAEWSPGGSSGGSGAALAAGMVPIATATDGGGSIRIPAALCGLAGLKPTNGLLGRRPIPSWMDLSTDGPLGTSIADLRLLLEVMRGPTAGDPTTAPSWTPREDMPSRVIAAPRTWDFGPLPEAMDERYRAALASIDRDLGLPLEEIAAADVLPGIGDPGDDWFVTVAVEELTWIGRDRVRENMDRFSEPFRGAMEMALQIPLDRYLEARRNRFGYVSRMDELLGDDAVFVCPTLGREGWLADGILPGTDEPPGADGYNCGEANLTGGPALSLPAGVCPNGIPFGLQVMGPRFRDDLVLAFGEAWERANPWPTVAPGYEPFAV